MVKDMKSFFKELFSYVIIIVVVVLIRTYIFSPAAVNGDSMISTLYNSDLVIINKVNIQNRKINRFDIVIIKSGHEKLIKRVIALPNEVIEYKSNTLYINGKEISSDIDFKYTDDFKAETKDDEYYVLGDNRGISKDSRILGSFNKKDIIGVVNYRFYPLDKIGKLK